METETFFKQRLQQVDMEAFKNILLRQDGEPPQPGDELRSPERN